MIEIFKTSTTNYEVTFEREGRQILESGLASAIKEASMHFPVNEKGVIVYMPARQYQVYQKLTKFLQRNR